MGVSATAFRKIFGCNAMWRSYSWPHCQEWCPSRSCLLREEYLVNMIYCKSIWQLMRKRFKPTVEQKEHWIHTVNVHTDHACHQHNIITNPKLTKHTKPCTTHTHWRSVNYTCTLKMYTVRRDLLRHWSTELLEKLSIRLNFTTAPLDSVHTTKAFCHPSWMDSTPLSGK